MTTTKETTMSFAHEFFPAPATSASGQARFRHIHVGFTELDDAVDDRTGHLPDELWMVVIDELPERPDPEAVARFLEEQSSRGIPDEDRGFYWPTTRRVYRSRSSARARLTTYEAYGARGHLVRCRPVWEPAETKDQQIARLQARVAELEGR